MVDINTSSTDVKGVGVPAMPAAVVREDKLKPRVAPVMESSDSETVKLDNKALHSGTKEALKKPEPLTREEVEKMIEGIQQRLDAIGSNLTFGFNEDKKTESIVVQITERLTGELVRQFPSEELLQIQAKLEDLIGLIFDSQA